MQKTYWIENKNHHKKKDANKMIDCIYNFSFSTIIFQFRFESDNEINNIFDKIIT